MKKNYMKPALQPMDMGMENMLAGSITNVGGNSGIGMGTGDAPEEADVNANPFGDSIFD